MLKNNSLFCDTKLRKREQGESCKLLSNRRKGPQNCHRQPNVACTTSATEALIPPCAPLAWRWPTGGAKCGKHQLKELAHDGGINQCFAVPMHWFLTKPKTACFSSPN